MINWEIHNSSQLTRIEYDEETKILKVLFKRGAVYQYFNVPHSIVDELISAESAGKYFNSNIAKIFKYEKVGG